VQPLVAIVILTWNGRNDTLECLASLQGVTYPGRKTIVVDNASADGTAEAVKARFPEAEVIVNAGNLRFAGGNNAGIRRALGLGADYILLLNNDTDVDPGFLGRLVEAAEKDPLCGMAAPKILYYGDRDRVWYAGGAISWWQGWISHIGVREKDDGRFDRGGPTAYVTGCCVLVKRKLVEEVGMLDEAYFIYGEDADWSIRAARKGYRLLYVPEARIWHKLSVSAGGHLSWFKNWNKLKSQIRLMSRYAKPYHWLTIPFGMGFNIVASFLRVKRSA
jgi:GT2 family glycosyltransferase